MFVVSVPDRRGRGAGAAVAVHRHGPARPVWRPDHMVLLRQGDGRVAHIEDAFRPPERLGTARLCADPKPDNAVEHVVAAALGRAPGGGLVRTGLYRGVCSWIGARPTSTGTGRRSCTGTGRCGSTGTGRRRGTRRKVPDATCSGGSIERRSGRGSGVRGRRARGSSATEGSDMASNASESRVTEAIAIASSVRASISTGIGPGLASIGNVWAGWMMELF